MDQGKVLLLIGVVWAAVCLYFVAMGGKHKKKPNPGFDKVPIILGISVAGLLGLLAIISYFFFE